VRSTPIEERAGKVPSERAGRARAGRKSTLGEGWKGWRGKSTLGEGWKRGATIVRSTPEGEKYPRRGLETRRDDSAVDADLGHG
jgi:hypothetical protein